MELLFLVPTTTLRDWDPMRLELMASAGRFPPNSPRPISCTESNVGSCGLDMGRDMVQPVLEVVIFKDQDREDARPPTTQPENTPSPRLERSSQNSTQDNEATRPDPQPTSPLPPPGMEASSLLPAPLLLEVDTRYVTTSRGSPPMASRSVEHERDSDFPRSLCRPIATTLPPPLPRPCGRRGRPARLPRRSSRLVKKTRNRTPAVLAVQNVLMRKLGITVDAPPEADDFAEYERIFHLGLTPAQVELIKELFHPHASVGGETQVEEEAPAV